VLANLSCCVGSELGSLQTYDNLCRTIPVVIVITCLIHDRFCSRLFQNATLNCYEQITRAEREVCDTTPREGEKNALFVFTGEKKIL